MLCRSISPVSSTASSTGGEASNAVPVSSFAFSAADAFAVPEEASAEAFFPITAFTPALNAAVSSLDADGISSTVLWATLVAELGTELFNFVCELDWVVTPSSKQKSDQFGDKKIRKA